MGDPIPPQNLEAERAVLGSMLLDTDAALVAMDMLGEQDFYLGRHRELFEVVRGMVARGKPVDQLTVVDALAAGNGTRETVTAEIVDLARAVPSAANVEMYAQMLRDCATRRAVIRACMTATKCAYAGDDDVLEMLERSTSEVRQRRTSGEARQSGDIILRVLKELDTKEARRKGWPTGFPDLDRMLKGGGLLPGSVVIVGALPSVGKSSWAMVPEIAFARAGLPVCVYGMDDTRENWIERALACMAHRRLPDIAKGDQVDEKTGAAIMEAANELDRLPIWIDETSGLTVQEIRNRARFMHRFHGIKLFVVDYVQMIRSPRSQDLRHRVTEVSGELKDMAKELDCCVLMLSQFSREATKTDRPLMSHLKESGQLEQDADLILLLHRDIGPLPNSGALEVKGFLDKNKQGPSGMIPFLFFADQFRFECKSPGTNNDDAFQGYADRNW